MTSPGLEVNHSPSLGFDVSYVKLFKKRENTDD